MLVAALTLSIYAATRSRQSPQVILLATLYLITVNLSLPFAQGNAGLVTVVCITSLLILGQQNSILLLAISLILAELIRPVWAPLWRDLDPKLPHQTTRRKVESLGQAFVYLSALSVAGLVFESSGGTLSSETTNVSLFDTFDELVASYAGCFLLASFVTWLVAKKSWRAFPIIPLVAEGLFSQLFALLGVLLFLQNGTPALVVFCLSITAVAYINWLSWRRRAILELQFYQFSLLNVLGKSLRETLDLGTVVNRIAAFVTELAPADRTTLFLIDDKASLSPAFDLPTALESALKREPLLAQRPFPDDFTRWVAERGTILDLNASNMHFAFGHGLAAPQPVPQAWLGIPLLSAGSVTGVLVLQSLASAQPYGRWDRELLLAIAGQAAAAIQNARLYEETARLYASTDEALAQRVNELQSLLDAIEDGVLMLDARGRIALVNKMAAAMLGADSVQLHGSLLSPTDAAAALGYSEGELARLAEALRKGETPPRTPSTFESVRLSAAKGAKCYVARADAPVNAPDGTLLGWLLLFKDVTEERQLAALRVDLTRMIVHDLRNPLTTLISNIELLANQMDSEARMSHQGRKELLSQARLGGYDMLDLVDSMMDVSRMDAGQAVVEADAMRLPRLVDQILERLRPLAVQKKIAIHFESAQELPPVWADEEMIRRVLMNLLDNALKFTPSGGQIFGRLSVEPDMAYPANPGNAGVRCVITDSGPGIPPEMGDRIFDRFMRTNPGGGQVRGTGLGLAFCKLAIEAHGGKIWVEEAPGGGSSFTFTLPGIPF